MKRDLSAMTLSRALVEHLRGCGMSLREIGEMVGLSESFISRVANGHRSFTIAHLELLEQELGQPLPALVLQARWGNSVPEEKRALLDEALRLLNDLGTLRRSLGSEGDTDEEENHRLAPGNAASSPGRR